METPKTLPKDLMGKQTTPEQWEKYQIELKNHQAWIQGRREFLMQILKSVFENGIGPTEQKFNRELDQSLSMDAPNEPGYYRANND